jgi:BarA-like signal transduction histidine kinase
MNFESLKNNQFVVLNINTQESRTLLRIIEKPRLQFTYSKSIWTAEKQFDISDNKT